MAFDDSAFSAAPAETGDAANNPAQSPQASPDLEQHKKLLEWIDKQNITDDLDDELLGEIGSRVKSEYEIDLETCKDWREKTQKSIDFAIQVAKEKSYPWPKAANVIYPLMTTAAIQFAARAYPAIIAGREVVKGVVIGNDDGVPMVDPSTGQPASMPGPDGQPQPMWRVQPGEKRQRAERIGAHMSFQLLDEMKEWEAETDQLLHILPITGCVFRKTYFDPGLARNVSLMVNPLNLVVNYWAKSLSTTPRATEELRLYPLEIKEMERAGLFREIKYTTEQSTADERKSDPRDEDAPREFLEQHRWLDLDKDDFPEPYIVTIHKATSQVVRIRARYEADGIQFSRTDHRVSRIIAIEYYTKYDFLPNIDGGFYGLGFGQLLRPVNEAINTTLNLMIDAGHLQVVGGGFIGKGLAMNTGAVRFSPGEYKMVNVAGSVVKDNVVPLQFPGPSMVLFQLLGLLMESGKEIASIKDVLTGEQSQHNVPATTTMALIEQGLKTFTAIYKRVHRALKEELTKIYRLNGLYLPEQASYRVGDDWKMIQRGDYLAGAGVEPISDPSMVSDMQRLAKAQFLMQFAQDPMFNGAEIRRRILVAAQIEKIDALLNPNPPPNPAVIAKLHEMETKTQEIQVKAQREKAAEMKDYAQAILYFAQADKVVGDMHLDWVGQQLEAWKAHFEASALGQGSETQPGLAGAPAPPGGPPPMPSAAHPGAHPIPGGETPPGVASPTMPGSPPMSGARQAPDGHWYLPDPARAGKFLQVIH